MADQERTATHALRLERELEAAPYRFGFFEALRRLECVHADKPRIGTAKRPADEPLRLGQEPSLAFAPSTIAGFRGSRDGKPAHMAVSFFGLFGPHGPLPLHLTEYARDRLRDHGDHAFRVFADIFHHRLLSKFYRAWADAQPTVNYDRPDDDRFALYVGAMFGMALPSLLNQDAVSDLAKLHHAGNFSGQTKHAEGLRGILQDFFDVPLRIEEFAGCWLELPHDSHLLLGKTPETGTLGRTTLIGSRVWDCQQKFTIVIGPLGYEDYERLTPTHDSVGRLAALVRNYVGDSLDWEVRLILEKAEVPPLMLGGTERLGWTSWLINRKPPNDAHDLLLSSFTCSRQLADDALAPQELVGDDKEFVDV